MDKYHEKVNNFRSLHDTIKCSHIPRSRLPVYEELSAFKNNLNNVLNDILKEPSFEERRRSRSLEITQAKRELGSGTKSMEHFEGYLMNRKDKGKVSLNKEEHKSFITIEDSEKSDRNTQLVKNSIQSIRDTIKGLNSTQDTNRKTFISNVFGSGSDEGSLAIFSDLKRTPRLNCELWEPPHNNINEFREDEESTYRRKIAQEKKSSCGWGFTQALGEIEIKENNTGNCNERKMKELNENDKFLSYLQPMLSKMANNKMK